MKKTLLITVAALCLMAACAREEGISGDRENVSARIENADLNPSLLQSGKVVVRVTPALASVLEECTGADGTVRLPAVRSLEPAVQSMNLQVMRRLFPDAGEFEPRTRAEGLHLWYEMLYDEGIAVTRSCATLEMIPGIELIEYQPKISIVGDYTVEPVPAPTAVSSDMPFNDPRLPDQWHYFNDGSVSGSQSGCDINVFPVWENYTTGNPDVIVCVVDGGIDFEHEDLADNMWHNPDMHGSGQYGYNFISGSYVVTPHDHGTHVAGTIAAVNNNGKGVCGIAGGNRAKGQAGVKLMSCQIFDNNGGNGSGSSAIKWGADHGAVISQNSWGMIDISSVPASLKAAVDYFVKYAGFDSNGKQTGPMAGGLVIFAAGNDNSPMDYTACYEPILAVSSVGADYRKAYYSNYGSWTDIAAPGGDARKGNYVLSTLPGNSYGRMQGTSMACPHVSGVAALLVSKYGGQGFTADALRKRLVENTTDISSYNRSWEIGSGLVNAFKSIAGSGGQPPEAVTGLTASASSNNVDFSLKIPSDPDDGKPYTVSVYYSTSPFSKTDGIMFGTFYVGSLKAGDKLSGRLTGLEFDTKYYIAALASDMNGNNSVLSSQIQLTTGSNSAPVIRALGPLEATVRMHESLSFPFVAEDPDGHFCELALDKGCEAEVLDTMKVRMEPCIRINPAEVEPGTYSSVLTVTDYYGLAASVAVKYTVLDNHAPVLVGTIPDQLFDKTGRTVELRTSDYFADEDGEQLNFAVDNSNVNVVSVNESEGSIYITSIGYGYASVQLSGTDVKGLSVSQTFRVLVRDGASPLDIYPNPVSDLLHVRTDVEADVQLKLVNVNGAEVIDEKLHVSPFEPATVDVKKLPSGPYSAVVSHDGVVITKKIMKI